MDQSSKKFWNAKLSNSIIQLGAEAFTSLQQYLLQTITPISLAHCSPESNLVKWRPPEETTTYSESSWPGDFKNDFEIGLASYATF